MVELIQAENLYMFVSFAAVLFVGTFLLVWLKKTDVRRIPVIDACLEALRVSTEKGTSLIMSTGNISLQSMGSPVAATAAAWLPAMLRLLKTLSEEAGKIGTRIIATTHKPLYAMMAYDFMQRGYFEGGHPEMFRSDNIVFFPDYTSYAIGVPDLILREKPGGVICLSYTIWGTNSTIYEACAKSDTFLVAGDVWPNDNSPAVIASDYVSFGEENIAIGAYLSDDPYEKANLVAEDFVKFFVIGIIPIIAILVASGVQI